MDLNSAESADAPAHEFLRVAAGQTLAAACAYLRDRGDVRIVGHNLVSGRWVIEVESMRAQ